MKKVISTRGISYHIEQIITKAQKEIILVTPFLKLPPEFYKRLIDASARGVEITIVYGKKELDKEQEELLSTIEKLELRYVKKLHAKVYLNESEGVIASMNLYQYSEINNFELGISFINDDLDKDFIYKDTCAEVQHIISQSELKKERTSNTLEKKSDIISSLFYSDNRQDILFENVPVKGINISKMYGFITYHIHKDLMSYEDLKKLRNNTLSLIRENVGDNYRFYWSHPYDKICIYYQKDIQFDNELQELSYCSKAIEKVNSQIKILIN